MLATTSPRLRAAAGSLTLAAPARWAQFVSLPCRRPGSYASLRQRASAAAAAAEAAPPAKEGAEGMGFEEMATGTRRRYYMLGGKGGVGKTSCAASLAVRFANNGHPTLVVSTDPAHSLSDSFAQDLSGGALVPVEGPEAPLFALEINPEKSREEFRTASQKNGGTGVKDFMDSMGLGMLAEQLGELKLGELLDSPPPGLDEAIAISKVMQFLEAQEYSMFSRIVFDTAPTGHTLRLLSLPDFLDASIGKILKLRSKIASATSAIKSVFGQEVQQQDAANKLEQLRERMVRVRELFRDTESTEFIIVTIPTVMAISESARLHSSLKKESVPVRRLIVNQILPPSSSDCKFCAMKRKDQTRALDIIRNDPELMGLNIIQAPLVDMEIRGAHIMSASVLTTSKLKCGKKTSDELDVIDGYILSFWNDMVEGGACQNRDNDGGEKEPKKLEKAMELQVQRRPSDHGSEKPLTFELVSRYFCMPIKRAAQELDVGLTLLKRRCRALGIPCWPHRKVKSMQTLINDVQELGKETEYDEDKIRSAVEMLQETKRLIEERPDGKLDEPTKKLRQACFKENYKRRTGEGSCNSRMMGMRQCELCLAMTTSGDRHVSECSSTGAR
ncbi:hypothetical protein ABZP36_032081 [Zizania latifolia]